MNEFIKALSSDPGIALGAVLGVIGIIGFTAITVCAVIASHWHLVRKTEEECDLKREMLSRGMSAADIETVMRAGRRRAPLQEVAEQVRKGNWGCGGQFGGMHAKEHAANS